MRAALVLFLVIILFKRPFAEMQITCFDLRNGSMIGYLLFFTSKNNSDFQVNFFLSTNEDKDPEDISTEELYRRWPNLLMNGFDPLKKTTIIIHGYKNSAGHSWVLEMKDRLLDTVSHKYHRKILEEYYISKYNLIYINEYFQKLGKLLPKHPDC